MDLIFLSLDKYLIVITGFGRNLGVILLIVGIILDIVKKRFHWSKYALIFLAVILVLEIIQVEFIYHLTSNFK